MTSRQVELSEVMTMMVDEDSACRGLVVQGGRGVLSEVAATFGWGKPPLC